VVNMKFELLVSTMHKSVDDVKKMLVKMNVHCDCLVINQCDEENYYEEIINNKFILRVFSTKERGLSNSRNMALNNARADIVGIADDDLYYYDNFDKTILDYYDNNPKADVVMFNIDDYKKSYKLRPKKCNSIDLFGFISMQITFKIDSIKNKNIRFNPFFGTGSKFFQSGEENIFLSNCYRTRMEIYYCPKKILKREYSESSWFVGYSDKKYLSDRGAIFYEMSNTFFLLLVLQFAIRKRKLFYPIKIITAIKYMVEGKEEYIKKCLYNCDNLNI